MLQQNEDKTESEFCTQVVLKDRENNATRFNLHNSIREKKIQDINYMIEDEHGYNHESVREWEQQATTITRLNIGCKIQD